jgi:bacillopeptidase F
MFAQSNTGTLSPRLAQMPADAKVEAYVFLRDRANLSALRQAFRNDAVPVQLRPSRVKQALEAIAQSSQQQLNTRIHEAGLQHAIEIKGQHHLINMLHVSARAEVLQQLAFAPEVEYIELASVFRLHYEAPVAKMVDASRSVGGHEPGLEAIHAPFMWNLGYTGLGRRLYTVDTGVWPIHPALSNQWRGNFYPQEQCWVGFDFPNPADKPDAHGTHVTGTVLGLDRGTADTIGIAFNATFMATDPIVEDLADVKPLDVILSAFEFALDPDNNPNTTDDVPDVICNSWGFGDTVIAGLCTNPFIVALYDALDAAGIAVEFSAGNEGPGVSTMGMPAYVVLDSLTVFSVGAVDAASPLLTAASFSSRGPSSCGDTPELQIKPEVCAPGVNVRSSVQSNQYAQYSGTSMAGPHVAGAVLLLKEAFPFLPGRELLNALYQTATDLGPEGEDNTYGRGIINLEAAYTFLSQSHTPVPPNTEPFDVAISSIQGASVSCPGSHAFTVNIYNEGSIPFGGGDLELRLNGVLVQTVPVSQPIEAGQALALNLSVDVLSGRNEIQAQLIPYVNTPERNVLNNLRMHTVMVQPEQALPYGESFEYNDFTGNNWFVVNPEYGKTWDTLATAGLSNSQFSGYFNFLANTQKQFTDLAYTPVITFPVSIDSLVLHFNYAYRYRNASFTDTVALSFSDDCGQTWNRVFYKGGQELETYDTTWTNFHPYLPQHWATFHQDIRAQVNGSSVMLKLEAINDGGTNFFIDNLFLYASESPEGLIAPYVPHFSLMPNPGNSAVQLQFERAVQSGQISVYNLMGAQVHVQTVSAGSAQVSLDSQSWAPGMYFVTFRSSQGLHTQRWVKQ